MRTSAISKIRDRRPFVPFVIEIDNGTEIVIGHPENLFVDDFLCGARDRRGRAYWFAPEAVSLIRPVNGRRN